MTWRSRHMSHPKPDRNKLNLAKVSLIRMVLESGEADCLFLHSWRCIRKGTGCFEDNTTLKREARQEG